MHRCCYGIIGSSDPYVALKMMANVIATGVVAAVRPTLSTVHDYIVAAVIGNAMDYGVVGHEIAADFTGYFHEMFARGLALDDTEEILARAGRVVYCTDNCGEVVFDKMLCEELRRRGSHVTMVVMDQSMLNDVTRQEATSLHPDMYLLEVVSAMRGATLILAKGLANYGSLKGCRRLRI